MKFLITDPCYIVTHDEWDRIGNNTGWGDTFHETLKGYHIEGVGTIKECDGTANGDGSVSYKGQTVGVDAGMVCLVEVEDDYKNDSWLGVVVDNGDEAYEVYGMAMAI